MEKSLNSVDAENFPLYPLFIFLVIRFRFSEMLFHLKAFRCKVKWAIFDVNHFFCKYFFLDLVEKIFSHFIEPFHSTTIDDLYKNLIWKLLKRSSREVNAGTHFWNSLQYFNCLILISILLSILTQRFSPKWWFSRK